MKHTSFHSIVLLLLLGTALPLGAQPKSRSGWALNPSYQNYLMKFSPQVRESFYYKAKTDEKIVSLTFDDGPMDRSIKLVDYLVKNKIPATFFVVAAGLKPFNIHLYQQNFFNIGMHTHLHDNYAKFRRQQIEEDVQKCVDAFTQYNFPRRYFRTAYGIIGEDVQEVLARHNLKGILWSIDSLDWARKGWSGDAGEEQQFVKRILDNLGGGAIILLHDRLPIRIVDKLVKGIRSRGFRFVTLDELMVYPTEYP